jgi:hypothetical protein
MIIFIQRVRSNHICSVGELFCEGFSCATLEPPRRIHGRFRAARLPANLYGLSVVSDENCPVAERYARRFGENFHHGMLALHADGQRYYVKMGNFPKDTQGDILVGLTVHDNSISESQTAYEELYPLVGVALQLGEDVMLDIRDEEHDYSR